MEWDGMEQNGMKWYRDGMGWNGAEWDENGIDSM